MLFSIIIPTYNNYSYLRMTIDSIIKNSEFKHQLIVHINGGDSMTKNYLDNRNIQYTFSNHNLGLCKGVNTASKLAKTDYIVYAHDDMYFLPKWDKFFLDEINNLNDNLFFLSGTQIGPLPIKGNMPNHIHFYAGKDLNDFDEKNLLKNYERLKFHDLQGSHWAPHIVHKEIWNRVGGFSEEFDPGFGSDPDLNMKLWQLGVRLFKGVNRSRTYHFGSLTTRKKNNIQRNEANRTFLKKWGISIDFFTKYYLHRGEIYNGPLNNFKLSTKNILSYLYCKIKYLLKVNIK